MLKSVTTCIFLIALISSAQINIYVDSSCTGKNSDTFFKYIRNNIETNPRFLDRNYKFVYDSLSESVYAIKIVSADTTLCAETGIKYYSIFTKPNRDYIHNVRFDEQPYFCASKNISIEALKVALKINKYISYQEDSVYAKMDELIKRLAPPPNTKRTDDL